MTLEHYMAFWVHTHMKFGNGQTLSEQLIQMSNT